MISNRFLARHARAKKLFSRSECRAVGEAQSGVKTLQKAGLGLTFA